MTALEIDPSLAAPLRERLAGRAQIVDGSGTAMPFDDECFSAAACFTMLHHVPSAAEQDELFAEVRRVLRPGAPFAGTDSTGRGLGFALLHIGDTRVLIDPDRPRAAARGRGLRGCRGGAPWARRVLLSRAARSAARAGFTGDGRRVARYRRPRR